MKSALRSPKSTSPQTSVHQQILDSVEDRVLERSQLVSASDLEDEFGAPGRRALEQLIQQRKLMVVFEGKGLPRVVAPGYMFEEALRKQRKPEWVPGHALPGREPLEARVAADQESLSQLDVLDRLLYATGDPLEEAVGVALEELGFESVTVTRNPRDCDVRFALRPYQFLAEAKGKGAQGDKQDILQRRGWMDQDLEHGTDPETLRGVLVVNPFRHLLPSQRGSPLTDEAGRLARMYRLGVWTTTKLHACIRLVRESVNPASVRLALRAELLAHDYLQCEAV